MEITPVTRTIEKVVSEQGTAFRCYGPHNAHYFLKNGIFQPVNVLAVAKDQVTTGKMIADLRNTHVVSVGINKAPSLEKIIGLRKDDCQDGREQLEITLESATYNNVPVTLNADLREKFSPLVDVIGNLRVYSDRHRTRVALPATNSVGSFRIVFKIHTVGLKATQEGSRFVFRDAKGRFRYALTEPKILRPDGRIYRFGDPETGKYWFKNTVAHHLEDLGKGEYRYIKESTDLFREMPTTFLIDAETCYSSTADGEVRCDGEKGDSWSDVIGAATGTVTITSSTTAMALANYASYTYHNYRVFFMYDTSGLSGSCSACRAYCYAKSGDEDSYSANFYKGTQGDTLTTDDYTAFTGSSFGGFTASGEDPSWEYFDFNATGIAAVNIGGTTYVAVRNSADVGGSYYYQRIIIHSADYTGTTYDPYLSVTMSTFTPKIICVC